MKQNLQSPELVLARDIARRGLLAAPLFLVAGAIWWGWAGVSSTAFALLLVIANFVAAAALMAWGAKRSPGAMAGAVLFGYVLRLAAITAAVLAVKDAGWVEIIPLAFTIIVAHLGLLWWEARYVSASLAYPVLKPTPKKNGVHA